jgi:hypothetical protein
MAMHRDAAFGRARGPGTSPLFGCIKLPAWVGARWIAKQSDEE